MASSSVKEWATELKTQIPDLSKDGATTTLAYALSQFEKKYDCGADLALEFGVWSGTSISKIAYMMPWKYGVYGFDSFEGLPEHWRDGYDAGSFARDQGSLPAVPNNVKLIKGWFNETLPAFCQEQKDLKKKAGFLHIDCDIYSSTVTIFDELTKADLIADGCVVVFDELFNYEGYEEHELKAFKEWLEKETSWDVEWIGMVGEVLVDVPKSHDICIDQAAAYILRKKK